MPTSKRQRLEAAMAGELADRPPVALWRHFPVDDQTPEGLAAATVAFQRRHDFDFVKVTPSSSYCLKDWGAQDRWDASLEGTRAYTDRVITDPQAWASLAELNPHEGSLSRQLECIRLIRRQLIQETPLIQTVFSPLAQAKNLAGQGRLLEHLHRRPELVLSGLEVITRSTVAFVRAAMQAGIDGIFYAIQHASFRLLDRAAYGRFGEPFDLRILAAAEDGWLNVLHLHGEALMFELAERYEAHVVNWHDRSAGPSLAEAGPRLVSAVCGGLRRHQTLVLGDPSQVAAEAHQALQSLHGRNMILSAGCVVPVIAPEGNLRAARHAVEDFA